MRCRNVVGEGRVPIPYMFVSYHSSCRLVHMDSAIQDSTVSSTSSYGNEQADNNENITGQIQVHEVSTTITSDVEAIMLSLMGLI